MAQLMNRDAYERFDKEIKEKNEELKKKYSEKLETYCKLRKLMEDENNHEDKDILNRLKTDKENDYKQLLRELKQKNDEFDKLYRLNNEIIQKNFKQMIDSKNKMLGTETEEEINEKLRREQQKREIFEKTMSMLTDKKLNKEIIDRVQNLMDKNDNNITNK